MRDDLIVPCEACAERERISRLPQPEKYAYCADFIMVTLERAMGKIPPSLRKRITKAMIAVLAYYFPQGEPDGDKRADSINPGDFYWIRNLGYDEARWEVGWVPTAAVEPVATKIISLIGMITVYPPHEDGYGFRYEIGPRIEPPPLPQGSPDGAPPQADKDLSNG